MNSVKNSIQKNTATANSPAILQTRPDTRNTRSGRYISKHVTPKKINP